MEQPADNSSPVVRDVTRLESASDDRLQQWRSAGIALKQTLSQIGGQHSNSKSLCKNPPEKSEHSSPHVSAVDRKSSPSKEQCQCKRKVPNKDIDVKNTVSETHQRAPIKCLKNQTSKRTNCPCTCHHNQDGMNEMLDDYKTVDNVEITESKGTTSNGESAADKTIPSVTHNISSARQRVQLLAKKAHAVSCNMNMGGRRRKTSQRSQASPAPQSEDSQDSDVDTDARLARRPSHHRVVLQYDHTESSQLLVEEDTILDVDGTKQTVAIRRLRVTPAGLADTDSVANMADIESCSDTANALHVTSSESEARITSVAVETPPTSKVDGQPTPNASFSVSYDFDSDDFEELHDLHLNIGDSHADQTPVRLSRAELERILPAEAESAVSGDGDADDEFECECCMCSIRPANLDSGWVTEVAEEIIGQDGGHTIEYYYDEVNDGYNMPFSFNEAEVSPLNSLMGQVHQRDIVEMMFQNVVRQMLSVYPELLGDQVPPPLNPSVINSLQTVKPVATGNATTECTCPICLCDFDEEEEAKLLPCQHTFHSFCIQAWLNKSGTCPVCRHVLAT